VFDSLPFRGVQVASDIGMLPGLDAGLCAGDSRRGRNPRAGRGAPQRLFAAPPYVPPGPFEINDLNASSGSGDLEVVIITEADGRGAASPSHTPPRQPAARETWLTVGEYNAAAENGNRPGLAQATLAYGLPYDYTLSGGLLGNDFYRATQLGLGKNLGSLGAISLDVTQARTEAAMAVPSRGAAMASATAGVRHRHLGAFRRLSLLHRGLPRFQRGGVAASGR
jgi:outer membrane usher protein